MPDHGDEGSNQATSAPVTAPGTQQRQAALHKRQAQCQHQCEVAEFWDHLSTLAVWRPFFNAYAASGGM